MLFFSGFSLRNEEYLFDKYLNKSLYTISGFSYGSIKALQETKTELESARRVDRLQLISPAFFQTKSSKFKRLQMLGYLKNRDAYIKQFIKASFYPYEKKIVEHKKSSEEELSELLNYEWSIRELKHILSRGVDIEVYLGEKDSIIDVDEAREFFLKVASVTNIKDANHFLQTN